MRRLFAALVVAGVLVGSAAPAGAHAELSSTEPAAGTSLDEAPARLLLRFTEGVEVSFGSIRMFAGDGNRVATGAPTHPDGDRAAVTVDLPGLDDGAYVVTWRVLSADSHPVQGAFTFRVGDAAATGEAEALAERLLASQGGSTVVGAVYAVVRAALFGALVLLVGAVVFLVALWPPGWRNRAARRLVAATWAATAVLTLVSVGLQGAYAGALGLADAVDPSVIDAVLDTRFGRASQLRLAMLAVAAPLLVAAARKPAWRRPTAVPLVVVGGLLLLTPGLAGHPGSSDHRGLALTADLFHLAGVSVWLGGLAVLAWLVLRDGEVDEAAGIAARFSRLAFGAVTVILGSGLVQSWLQVRSVDAATGTTFGRLLLVKVGLFAVMVAVAALSRSVVRRRLPVPVAAVSPGLGAAASDRVGAARAQLRRSVAAEVAVAVAILVVTALLVNAVPARTALAQPWSGDVHLDDVLVEITVDPAKAGPLDVHLYALTHAGVPTEVESMDATLSLRDEGIEGLGVPLERAGTGHFAAYGVDVPFGGDWELEIDVRLSEFEQDQGAVTVPIR